MQHTEYETDKHPRQTGGPVPRPLVPWGKLKSLGIQDHMGFQKKFDQICKNWWDKVNSKSNTTAGMLITSTLGTQLEDPVVLSIIADDVNTFNKYYHLKCDNIFYLELCCLCGSEKIITSVFLKDGDKKECLILSKNAIAYALSSGNSEVALSLAQTALQLGKTDPGHVMLYSPLKLYQVAKTIQQMFIKPGGTAIDEWQAHKNDKLSL